MLAHPPVPVGQLPLPKHFLISDQSRLYVNDHERTLDDYLAILKRRKWQLTPAGVAPVDGRGPCGVVASLLYTARTATILIEQQEFPAELVAHHGYRVRGSAYSGDQSARHDDR